MLLDIFYMLTIIFKEIFYQKNGFERDRMDKYLEITKEVDKISWCK
jgi:hypothetical protein